MSDINAPHLPTQRVYRGASASNIPEEWRSLAEANQEPFDRRRKSREKPPKTAARIKIQRVFNQLAYKIYASRGYQIGFGLITLFSFVLIWFTLSERISLINQNYVSIGRMGELESELLKTRQLWSTDRMDEISESIKNADQRRVFADYQNLASWLFEKNRLASQLALDFSYQLGDGQIAQIDNTLEVPISITLNPQSTEAEASFSQLMAFTRHIVSASWYVDIQEASISSDGKGIKAMKLKIVIWVHGQVNTNG